MTSIGVGWVEGPEDFLAEQLRNELLNVVAGLPDVPCGFLRSDETKPPLNRSVFGAPNDGGGATRLADRVDLLMLGGHGSGSSFDLGANESIGPNNVTFGGSLRCLVMVSCAILEGDPGNVTGGPEDWGRAFAELHHLIGPSTFVTPSPGRGERFASYLRDGYSFVDAWRYACDEAGGSGAKSWRWLVRADDDALDGLRSETLGAPAPDAHTMKFHLFDLNALPSSTP